MKSLVLCACVLIIGSSSSIELKQQSRDEINAGISIRNNFYTCMAENNVTASLYSEEDIMTNVHTQSENEERTKKIGCFIACFLKKQNLMEGSTIKEEEITAMLDMVASDTNGKLRRIVPKCMKEARSITQECEKSFSVYACSLRGIYEERNHEEHEKKVETEEAVTETEQAE